MTKYKVIFEINDIPEAKWIQFFDAPDSYTLNAVIAKFEKMFGVSIFYFQEME